MFRKVTTGFLAFAVLGICSGKAHAQLGSFFRLGPSVPEVSVQELHQLLAQQNAPQTTAAKESQAKPFVLVDVRSSEEQAVSIIPGAITKSKFEQNRDQYRGYTVISYCTVGGRSGQYATQLAKRGVKAKNFKGSILQWVNAELPLVTLDGKPTNRVHTYSSRYRVPSKYKAVW